MNLLNRHGTRRRTHFNRLIIIDKMCFPVFPFYIHNNIYYVWACGKKNPWKKKPLKKIRNKQLIVEHYIFNYIGTYIYILYSL